MNTHRTRKILLSTILLATIAILAGVYVLNGSEFEDAWLYLSSAAVVAGVMVPELYKKESDM